MDDPAGVDIDQEGRSGERRARERPSEDDGEKAKSGSARIHAETAP
jgi:hypothetical protein